MPLDRGIYYADSGTSLSIATITATMADSIADADDAIEAVTEIYDYRWADSSARAAEAGMRAGDRGYQADTGVDYWYSGSAWLANMPGLNLVVPTSVAGSGVSVSNRGTVTITAASTASLNGVFTSRFENYLIQLNTTAHSAAADVQVRLRASGTDNSGASAYGNQRTHGNASSITTSNSAGTLWIAVAAPASMTRSSTSITLMSPATTATTSGHMEGMVAASATSMYQMAYGWYHTSASAFDGITFFPASGTFTGTVRVYGYGQ